MWNMKDLFDREAVDPNAAEAFELFCYQARKYAAAMVAAARGVAHPHLHRRDRREVGFYTSPYLRRAGVPRVSIDPGRNASHARVISRDGSPVSVRVIPAAEEITIARETLATVGGAD